MYEKAFFRFKTLCRLLQAKWNKGRQNCLGGLARSKPLAVRLPAWQVQAGLIQCVRAQSLASGASAVCEMGLFTHFQWWDISTGSKSHCDPIVCEWCMAETSETGWLWKLLHTLQCLSHTSHCCFATLRICVQASGLRTHVAMWATSCQRQYSAKKAQSCTAPFSAACGISDISLQHFLSKTLKCLTPDLMG